MDKATTIGIDVGGQAKGFHAVALKYNEISLYHSRDPIEILAWCQEFDAQYIAIDSPCSWSENGKSRIAERILCAERIWCFATPTEERARYNSFYGWVHNGLKLYETINSEYPLYRGKKLEKNSLETFPHAIVCALHNKIISAKSKNKMRRSILSALGIDDRLLPNIDFVDAAICALAASAFSTGHFRQIGNANEGFIILPHNWEPGERS